MLFDASNGIEPLRRPTRHHAGRFQPLGVDVVQHDRAPVELRQV
jgi:hypothetical protein